MRRIVRRNNLLDRSTRQFKIAAPAISALIIAVTTLWLIAMPVAAQRALPDSVQATIDALNKVASDVTKDPENGSYTLAILSKDGILWIKSFGYADVERRLPATPASVYRIYSITKQFTAVMLLQLIHDGKVRLSEPAEDCLPSLSKLQRAYPGSSPITLLQLATHTSGLPLGPQEYERGSVANWEQQLDEALDHTSLSSEPGTQFEYSNLGYAALGACLAHATGTSYQGYVRDHILSPLEMTHTGFEKPVNSNELAVGYEVKDDKLNSTVPDEINNRGLGYAVPCSSLFSTAEDLARFLRFEMGGGSPGILSPKELQDNYDRIVISSGDLVSGFGIGFQAFTPVHWAPGVNATFYGHTGGYPGYTNAIMFETHTKIGFVLLHNDGRDSHGFAQLLGTFIHTLDISKMPASSQ
jgi:CubicO group peptidase (beta-lactamase class C family)